MKKEHQEIVENLKDLSRASIVSEAVKVIEELSAEIETIRKKANNWFETSIAYAEERDALLKKRDNLKSEVKNLTKARDHWRAEAERWRERGESTVETATDDEEWRQAMKEWKETQSIDLGLWESAVEEIRRDRDAWRTMALALVEKINQPTP